MSRTVRIVLIGVAAVALVALVFFLVSSNGDDGSGGESSGENTTEAIMNLQRGLTELGYYGGPIDGIYGSATTEAVAALQEDLGVTVDGRYGPETHAALIEALGTVESEAVKSLQKELKDLGYYEGEIDGIYGPETTEAIKKLQADCNLPQDGIYGPKTHDCLVDMGGDA